MDVIENAEHWQALLKEYPQWQSVAEQVLCASDYVVQQGERAPDKMAELLQSGDLQRQYAPDEMAEKLQQSMSAVSDETSLHRVLRQFRHREMVRIIWRDLSGDADLAETTGDLSAMADCCIQQALAWLDGELQTRYGTPQDENGTEQSLIVLGMGKLGARELNLSSDIDLIFCYAEDGETQGGKRPLFNEEYFRRLGQKLIQALDNVTVDGFVFRVDMRLRPFGDSGALAVGFDAMEEYYQTQGREWERYAMIKARAITGREEERQALSQLLRPFVYRRYLDYGMFDSLREMKSMIAGQLHRRGMESNIKLGAGGIREIEFIGQVFQLINGGRDRELQQRPILIILDCLGERDILADNAVADLKAAYAFMRRTEHRLQAWADQQTHLLPEDDHARLRLARTMGCDDWSAFHQTLQDHRDNVHEVFEQVLTAPQADDDATDVVNLLDASEEDIEAFLTRWDYADPARSQTVISKLLALHITKHLSHSGHDRLKKLLPLLVQAAAGVDDPDGCLERLMPLLEAIMRRSAYMALLVENPLALSQLVRLCAASPLISHQLARYPVLLDELLDPRSLYEVPGRETLSRELDHFLASVDETDLEQQMNRLREFRQIATLHVAAADVTGVLPLMRVGDHLSELAELLLERVLDLAWQHLAHRHGKPPSTEAGAANSGFAVIAYGKLGGLELGYGSDLDLVFVFDDDAHQGDTDGDKPVDAMVFYTRLAQRMIHLMNTITPGGILYEVDMRLRPQGSSGLVVSPLSGFRDYQFEEAWTWEHQALVRARCVAGDSELSMRFTGIRQQVLSNERDAQTLAEKVADMRTKMRRNLDKSTTELFDLKQAVGGITDIEFMVQYAVLAWSSTLPDLMVYTDNIRILDALVASDKLSADEGEMLADAYRHYRGLANRCVLQERPTLVPVSEAADYPAQIRAIWQRWLGSDKTD